ncbi:unnamed protein product [Tilletia controversa]|uniref:Mitochondrial zinc maintenance protein 1, mitochondrial n=1 Tax=Tilletia controversa TaxID=13291 RepID=A0A8X7SVX3_9BASI|nr:hypothetical protein CF328_g4252 [Tilletia controversa]KAE8246316.1 hypothetical protein A4X06_0g5065 [Tilletia controversa]CAD6900539.1 unnamed protein product [Tilletia controversa]
MAASLSPAQRTHLLHLYRRILRASEAAFADDQATHTAWRNFAASRFRSAEPDPAKYEEHVKHAEEVEDTLRKNVVQGKWREETGAYALRFRPETELGSNETIKQNRNKQIADLKSSKRPSLGCGGAAASSSRTAAFSTFSSLRAPSSSSSSAPSSSSARPSPRPIPTFPSLTILADGSSILLQTTSPRHTARLTRDPSNHPLWNPALADRRPGGGGDGEESEDIGGRLGRFRRRFDTESTSAPTAESSTTAKAPAAATPAASQKAGAAGARTPASTPTPAPAAASSKRAASFGMDDLDWMSVGGRQARAGSEPARGKGKKK